MEGPGAKGETSGSWVVGGTWAGQTGNRKQFLGQGWEWHLAGVYPGCIHGLWRRALIHEYFLILPMSSGHKLVPLSRWGALDGG